MDLEANREKRRKKTQRLGLAGFILLCIIVLAGYYVWKQKQFRHYHQPSSDDYIDRHEWGAFVKNVVFYNIPTKPFDSSMNMGSTRWPDIEPNFLIRSDGEIIVGRGWHVQPQPRSGYETEYIAIFFLDMFEKKVLSELQNEAAQRLVEKGVQLQTLDPHYHIEWDTKFTF